MSVLGIIVLIIIGSIAYAFREQAYSISHIYWHIHGNRCFDRMVAV